MSPLFSVPCYRDQSFPEVFAAPTICLVRYHPPKRLLLPPSLTHPFRLRLPGFQSLFCPSLPPNKVNIVLTPPTPKVTTLRGRPTLFLSGNFFCPFNFVFFLGISPCFFAIVHSFVLVALLHFGFSLPTASEVHLSPHPIFF